MTYFETSLCRGDQEIAIQVGYSAEKGSFENGYRSSLDIDSVTLIPANIAKSYIALFTVGEPIETTAEENHQIRADANHHFASTRR